MSDLTDLERRVIALEAKLDVLRDAQTEPKPDAKPFWRRVFSWQGLANFVALIGVPAAIFAAYDTLDARIIGLAETQIAENRALALEKIQELQSYQATIFELQADDRSDVAFARLEATRGQFERLAVDLYGLWEGDPEVFWTSEKVILSDALIGLGRTDSALALADSIPLEGMDPIASADTLMLRARALFARGPAQNPEAARDALRDAVAETGKIEDPGVQTNMNEKLVSVRLINELWLSTPCADVAPMAEFLAEVASDGVPAGAIDAVRRNTLSVLDAYALCCGS